MYIQQLATFVCVFNDIYWSPKMIPEIPGVSSDPNSVPDWDQIFFQMTEIPI